MYYFEHMSPQSPSHCMKQSVTILSLARTLAHSGTHVSTDAGSLVRPMDSVNNVEGLPLGRTSRHLSQQAQMELLGFPQKAPDMSSATGRRASGDLSRAARVELIAAQVKDEAALGPVDEESLNSNFGGSSNHWRSSNTSSSSQTHALIQRMTRLDTAAWQIAYHELKFSRLIGEGSFGRVFLGKWRETTVAIKLLSPSPHRAEARHDSDSDDTELCSTQASRCKPGLLDDLDKEAGIMAALRHPNVVMFLGVCLEPPAMVAEVCTGYLAFILPLAMHIMKVCCRGAAMHVCLVVGLCKCLSDGRPAVWLACLPAESLVHILSS